MHKQHICHWSIKRKDINVTCIANGSPSPKVMHVDVLGIKSSTFGSLRDNDLGHIIFGHKASPCCYDLCTIRICVPLFVLQFCVSNTLFLWMVCICLTITYGSLILLLSKPLCSFCTFTHEVLNSLIMFSLLLYSICTERHPNIFEEC